jgi:hypothetical protein
MKGTKSVKDALKEWQAKGNIFLLKLNDDPKAQMDPADLQRQ